MQPSCCSANSVPIALHSPCNRCMFATPCIQSMDHTTQDKASLCTNSNWEHGERPENTSTTAARCAEAEVIRTLPGKDLRRKHANHSGTHRDGVATSIPVTDRCTLMQY